MAFEKNVFESNGVGILCEGDTLLAVDNDFRGNIEGITLRETVASITNNVFTHNGTGVNVSTFPSIAVVADNLFTSNSSSGVHVSYVGAARSTITHNVFAGNFAAVAVTEGEAEILGNAFLENSNGLVLYRSASDIGLNTIISGDGYGISLNDSSANIANNVIAGYSVGLKGVLGSNAQQTNNGMFNVTNYDGINSAPSNVEGDPLITRSPFDGQDGFGDDPNSLQDESTNDDYGDLRFQPGSPCINAGDPNYVPVPGETDLDGHARVFCGRVDMGAYEFGIGDYDCDQAVSLLDFIGWEGCQTDPSATPSPRPSPLKGEGAAGCEAFDFDADGDVDLGDFAQLMLIATP